MINKLSQIIENKRREVRKKKKNRDFLGAILKPKQGKISIISEIKLYSPTEGKLGDEKELEERAVLYKKSGADAVSLVVDKKYFAGDLKFVRRVKNSVSLPILVKDFIIDPYQIYEAKIYGADAILIIAKIINRKQLKDFVELSFKIGAEPVVEIQNNEELNNAIAADTRVIAVNARNLDTFQVDIDRACELCKIIPKKFIVLGFSGVSDDEDVMKYENAGVKGVLVGTSLMKSKNPGNLIKEFKSL